MFVYISRSYSIKIHLSQETLIAQLHRCLGVNNAITMRLDKLGQLKTEKHTYKRLKCYNQWQCKESYDVLSPLNVLTILKDSGHSSKVNEQIIVVLGSFSVMVILIRMIIYIAKVIIILGGVNQYLHQFLLLTILLIHLCHPPVYFQIFQQFQLI